MIWMPGLTDWQNVLPRTAVTICTRADGYSWKTDHFAHSYTAMRNKLGLPDDLQFHGLRHSAASRLAEAGVSGAEIQAITGHETRAMVEHYTKGAKQKNMAKPAIAKLSRQHIRNITAKLSLGEAKPASNLLKKLVSPVGVEPTAIRLKVECSTTELQALL